MLVLIDGDVLAHMCCKTRFSKGGNQVYTDIVEVVPDKRAVQFSKEEDRKYLEDSWENFKKRLDEVLELCFADDYLMAVKSKHNFRDTMYPMEFNEDKTKAIWGYKANRWKPEGQSNRFVPIIRDLAKHEDIAIEAVNREADDLLRIWANQAAAANEDYIIATIDKDLKCIPGKHFNIKSQEITTVTEFEATRFFYQQLLSGDTTDNIPGVPGIGPIKAEKFLYNISDEEAMQELIVEMYMSVYEDNWYEMLLSNGKMLYLQKTADDYFRCSHWPVVAALGVAKYTEAIKPSIVSEIKQPPVIETAKSTIVAPMLKSPVIKSPAIKAATLVTPTLKSTTVRPFTGTIKVNNG